MTTAKKIKKTSTRWRPASFFLFASFFFSIFFFFFLLFFLLFFFFSKESTALSAGWDKTITAGVEGEEEGEEEKKSTKSPSVGLYKSGPSFAYAAMTQRRPRPLISKCAIAADLHRRPPRRPHLHAKKKTPGGAPAKLEKINRIPIDLHTLRRDRAMICIHGRWEASASARPISKRLPDVQNTGKYGRHRLAQIATELHSFAYITHRVYRL